MNLDLAGLKASVRWKKKKLSGLVELGGVALTDQQVRLVVERGLEKGYKTLHEIPDETAKEWLALDKT